MGDTLPAEAGHAIKAAEADNLPAIDSIIFGELMHLPLPGKELRMVAMQVRAALHRHGHLAENHYFAVDYTGCIHEAPDRETTIKWAEDFARTANGGAIGSERPEVAAAIGSLARRAAVPSEQEPVAWRSWAGAPGAVSVKRPDGVEAHTVVETIDTDGRRAISRADRVNWNIELSEDGVWVTHWRFAHPAPAAGRDAVIEEIAEWLEEQAEADFAVAEDMPEYSPEGYRLMLRSKWRKADAAAIRALAPMAGREGTRIYIDCEFNGWMGELLSFAMVAEDGREFYSVLPEPRTWDEWCFENIFPVLNKQPVASYDDFRVAFLEFLRGFRSPVIVADWPADLYYFTKVLLGNGHGDSVLIPCRMELVACDYRSAIPHNALEDARAIMRALKETR